MPKRELTKRQEAAVKRFVAANKEYARGTESLLRHRSRLGKKRLRALATALNAGVYGTTLAQRSGLATSRLYQMQDELKESK